MKTKKIVEMEFSKINKEASGPKEIFVTFISLKSAQAWLSLSSLPLVIILTFDNIFYSGDSKFRN